MIAFVANLLVGFVNLVQIGQPQELPQLAPHDYFLILPVASKLSFDIVLEKLAQLLLRVGCQHRSHIAEVEKCLARTDEFAEVRDVCFGLFVQNLPG